MQPGSDGWQPLHPLSPLLRAGRMLAVIAVAATQSIGAFLDGGFITVIAVLVAVLFSSAYGYVAWLFMRFRMQDEHIELREGILFRSHKRVPLARLETVDILRPVLARIFGVAEVRVELAGSKGSELRLRYLSEKDAVATREKLLSAHAAESPAPTPADFPGYEVFKQTSPEVVVAAVKTSDLILGYAAAQIAIPVFVFVIGDAVVAVVSWQAALVALVSVGAVMITWLFAVVALIEKSWGFRLSESDGGFAIRRGLLNLLTQKVPLHRVQAVRIVTPLIWRPFKRSRLVVDIAGYGDERGAEKQASSVLLPIGPPESVRAILNKVFPDLELTDVEFQMPPRIARWRAPFFWRTYGVAWTPTFAITRAGVFKRNIDVVPHRKIQSLRITNGPWQKRLGLATLHVDTAGNNVNSAAKHRQIAQTYKLALASRAADQAD